MTYPRNAQEISDLPDLYHDAKIRLSEIEKEVYELRERIIATGEPIIIGCKYRVTVDPGVVIRTLDKDRLRLFMSDKMLDDCMRDQRRTYVRLKTIHGKPVNVGRGKGRYRPSRDLDEG